MKNAIMRLWKEDEAQDLLEYSLLIALIVLIAAAAIDPLGQTMAKIFNNTNNCLKTPSASTCG